MDGGGQTIGSPPPPNVWSNSLAKICINKDNILDLIYIKFIKTHFMGGGQNILSPPPPPHIFEWGVRRWDSKFKFYIINIFCNIIALLMVYK